MLNLYITSPEKKDGKTFITGGLAATMQSLSYKTSVYKPIQTAGIEIDGFMQSPDLTFVKAIDPYIDTHFTYLFKENDEPLIASEKEGNPIDLDIIYKDVRKFAINSDCIIIDGDCGILSPIAPNLQNLDIVNKLMTPVLFVVKPRENAVNNILLSVFAAEEAGAKVNGVVINDIDETAQSKNVASLVRIIEEYTDVKVLGLVPNLGKNIEPEDLITGILNGIDIESVFGVKIAKLDLGK